MRAAVLHGEAGSGDLRLEQRDAPEPGPGQVRVRVLRSGICGSDVHFVFDGTARPAYTPIILGHEPMGTVDQLGDGVTTVMPGQRVSLVPLVTCATCDRCQRGQTVLCEQRACLGADVEGTFADFVVVPERNLIPIPDGVDDDLAAVATDSVATAYHAAATRGGVREGSRVAVWGVGGLGLSAVGIARTLGAAQVIAVDPRAEARGWALETGADEAIDPDGALARIQSQGGVDVAMEFVGRSETVEATVRSLDHGGRAVITGVGHDQLSAGRIMTFVLREREVVGSYGSEPHEVATVLELMADGRLSLPRVVGDVVPFASVAEAIGRVRDGRTGGSRILVDLS